MNRTVIVLDRHFNDCDTVLNIHYSHYCGTATVKLKNGRIKLNKYLLTFKAEVDYETAKKLINEYATVETINVQEFINSLRKQLATQTPELLGGERE